MDSIKKKMQAMKIEKENALDKSEQLEQKLRDVEETKAKIEEDLSTLQKKHTNLENEFDKVNEQYQESVIKLEAQEKRVTEGQLTNQDGHTGDMKASSRVLTAVSVESIKREIEEKPSVETECFTSPDKTQESEYLHSPVLDLPNENETLLDMQKKKSSVKKVKKKRKKTKTESDVGNKGDNSDTVKRSDKKTKSDKSTSKKVRKTKSKSSDSSGSHVSLRPEPEGGNCIIPELMDEYDRIIYTNYPIFSDLEQSDDDLTNQRVKPDQRKRYQNGRQHPEGSISLPCALGINSGSMLKFSIIDAELKNIIRGALRMVGKDLRPSMSYYLHVNKQ